MQSRKHERALKSFAQGADDQTQRSSEPSGAWSGTLRVSWQLEFSLVIAAELERTRHRGEQVDVVKTYVMPVVVAIAATWLAGFLWFRVLFRVPAADGLSPSTISLLQHIGDIGFACLLAWIMFRTGMHTILDGILLAIAIWVAFVAAVAGHMFAFRSFTLQFLATTAGSVLFALVTIGVVLGAIVR